MKPLYNGMLPPSMVDASPTVSPQSDPRGAAQRTG